ncbi:DUF7017 domain-containing protein [Hymenobacter pini]|uniref:DUF7017 domain-containing protein n=1 Tax=Hymenobacter pini TaxID=2880879 RepID=UPI001CF4CE93|nr:hypothetical protein [Hymenobacter pini]MCA8831934.1 hypothetical protein [Hymenobacter pini]
MPTVTELRKAGRLDEALTQGLAELAAKPTDVWAKRNMAWVYYEQLKLAAADTTVSLQPQLQALADLGLGADEELLYTQIIWQVVKRIYALAKAPHAIGAWLEVKLNGSPVWTRSTLPTADVRYRYRTEVQQVLGLLAEMPYPRPCEAHSALLKAVVQVKEKSSPLPFLLTYGPAYLRADDFVGEEYQGRQQAALAQQVFMGIARELSTAPLNTEATQDFPAHIAAFLPQLTQVIEKYPGYQWLPYFRAKLQLRIGDAAAALPTLLPVVRQKSSEFWAWQLLVETLTGTDPAAALACLYRATTCRTEEKFLRGLRLNLAAQLAVDHPGEARWQLQKAEETTNAEGWPVRGEMLLLRTQLAGHPAAPDEATRRQWLALAEQTAYGDLPWQPVVLQYIREAAADKPAQVRLLPAGADAKPLSVPLKRYPWLSKSAPGTPLQVRTEQSADYQRVVQLAARPAGKLWDVLPAHVVVLTGFTADRAMAFFGVRPGFSGAFRPAEFQLLDLEAGDTVEIRLRSQQKDGETKHFALTVEPTSAASDARLCRDFAGSIKILDAGFGFADNVFLPASLIARHGWQQGDTVSGRAVMQHNKKKGKDEWNVVRVK